jgi:hypothetical protein
MPDFVKMAKYCVDALDGQKGEDQEIARRMIIEVVKPSRAQVKEVRKPVRRRVRTGTNVVPFTS